MVTFLSIRNSNLTFFSPLPFTLSGVIMSLKPSTNQQTNPTKLEKDRQNKKLKRSLNEAFENEETSNNSTSTKQFIATKVNDKLAESKSNDNEQKEIPIKQLSELTPGIHHVGQFK